MRSALKGAKINSCLVLTILIKYAEPRWWLEECLTTVCPVLCFFAVARWFIGLMHPPAAPA